MTFQGQGFRKRRQLNYELLRILAMLMIVSLHYLSKGGLLGDPARADMTAVGYTAWLVEAFCIVAVNVYVLISGYFGVDAKESPADGDQITLRSVLRRPLRIWMQVFFYSMLFGCGALVFGLAEFDLYQFFSYCFPIVTEHYWFATYYVVLCLLMPFLNAGMTYLDQKKARCLLFGFVLVLSVSKTVIPMKLPWDKGGYDSLWFVVLYLTGAYLRRYGLPAVQTRWKAAALYGGSVTAVFASFFLIRMIYLRTGSLGAMIQYGYTYNFLFCYTGAVGLFLLFGAFRRDGSADGIRSGVPERFRKPIELLSEASFGVYLIHEHINIRYAWPRWFQCGAQTQNSVAGFLVHMLLSVLCVYLVCTVIELIRRRGARTILPALILLLYPLRHALTGVDLMDAGYALGNYRFFEALNETWKLATYLANRAGILLSKLPFGAGWAGMNVYCGLLLGAAAAGVYLFLQRRYGQKRGLICALLFAAELTALSLCWAPVVILYHYLGYLLMTAAVIVLYVAIVKERTPYFVAAGIILGICVAVRMPNITFMALILPVWCDCFWKRSGQRRDLTDCAGNQLWFRKLITRTLYCVGGYLAGVAIPLAAICVRYGLAAYPRMIAALFGMTDHAADYKPASMVTAMFGDYIQYSVWLILFVCYLAAGMLFFRVLHRFVQGVDRARACEKKITVVFWILYAVGLAVLLRFCYGRGMFGFDYSEYFSMYKWVTVYLLIVLGMCAWLLLDKRADSDLKLWAVFLPVIILVTPLGSNNGLYPIINNLLLVMPVSLLMAREALALAKKEFAFRLVFGTVLVCTAVQSILFGVGFVFHDAGARGAGQDENSRLVLQCDSAGAGLLTTADRKAAVEELDTYLYENRLNQKQVILYGDIPGMAYLFGMEPAISTTWADLDSYDMALLNEELARVAEGFAAGSLPVMIVGRASADPLTEADGLKYQKLRILTDFAAENGYRQCFENEAYRVFCVY